MKTIEIAIIDDHNIFRDGIILVLNQISHFKVIYNSDNGYDFLSFLNLRIPDIVLMDINMPIINGIDLARLSLEKKPDLKIIVLTMFADLVHYNQMINLGVKGFVIKKSSKEILKDAIETVYYGEHYFSREILHKLALQTMHNNKLSNKDLTHREKEILRLICQGKTTYEISNLLFISHKTVETHRSNIFKKAQVRNIAELIIWAVKNNYFVIS